MKIVLIALGSVLVGLLITGAGYGVGTAIDDVKNGVETGAVLGCLAAAFVFIAAWSSEAE